MKIPASAAATTASTAGALLLVVAVAAGASNLYYRPTIEHTSSDGRSRVLSPSTTNVITVGISAVVGTAGAAFLWLGRRWRR